MLIKHYQDPATARLCVISAWVACASTLSWNRAVMSSTLFTMRRSWDYISLLLRISYYCTNHLQVNMVHLSACILSEAVCWRIEIKMLYRHPGCHFLLYAYGLFSFCAVLNKLRCSEFIPICSKWHFFLSCFCTLLMMCCRLSNRWESRFINSRHLAACFRACICVHFQHVCATDGAVCNELICDNYWTCWGTKKKFLMSFRVFVWRDGSVCCSVNGAV